MISHRNFRNPSLIDRFPRLLSLVFTLSLWQISCLMVQPCHAQQIHFQSGTNLSTAADSADNGPCLIPRPDPIPPVDTSVVTPAHDSGNQIVVKVSKPFPKCAALHSFIDQANPKIDPHGIGQKEPAAGSATCLLAAAVNGSFQNCQHPAKPVAATGAQLEPNLLEDQIQFAVINLVSWKNVDEAPVKTSDWYGVDLRDKTITKFDPKTSVIVTGDVRIPGVSRVGFLAIHLGIDDSCGIQYSVKTNKRTPQNISDLQLLYSTIASIYKLPNPSPQNNSPAPANPATPATPTTDNLKANSLEEIAHSDTRFSAVIGGGSTSYILHTFDALGIGAPSASDPAIGVYGYASFQGLEKLPYDLVLTGKPSGTVRTVTDKDTDRISKPFDAVDAATHEVAKAEVKLQPRSTQKIAWTWDNDDVPITCKPLPTPRNQSAAIRSRSLLPAPAFLAPSAQSSTAPRYQLVALRTRSEQGALEDGQAQAANNASNSQPSGQDSTANDTQNQPTFQETYPNEGLYRWDVSVGVSAFAPRKVTYSASDGTVQKETTQPVNAYAFFDFFPIKTDLISPPPVRFPSISVGLPVGSQPFQRPTLGTSIGLKIGSFHIAPFIGALFLTENRPQALAIGSTATQDQLKANLEPHHNIRLFVSVNFSVKDAVDFLKNKGSSQSTSK